MKKIAIIIYYPYLDGTTTSLIDLYFNLKWHNDVKCYFLIDTSENNVKRNIEYMTALNKSVPMKFIDSEYISLNKLEDFVKNNKFDNLIMSFGIFRFMNNIPFQYEKLFILDAGRIIYDYYVNDSYFINYVKRLHDVNVLGNKMNCRFFNDWKKYNIYYHVFSHERFNKIKAFEANNIIIDENCRENTGNLGFSYLCARELYYNRWRDVCGDGKIFSENIGKLIFEFSAMNRKVVYSPKNKTHDDGLTEYLSLFGINDGFYQNIYITEKELFDKLGCFNYEYLFI